MPLITWNDAIAVGIGSIDTQHKKWIDLINTMHDAMATGKAQDALNKTIAEVVTYTKLHFGHEESLTSLHRYPGFVEHKALHEAFVKKILEMQAKQKDTSATVSIALMNSLRSWLLNHIQKVDKLYAPHLKSLGAA
jgi:hemerythrin